MSSSSKASAPSAKAAAPASPPPSSAASHAAAAPKKAAPLSPDTFGDIKPLKMKGAFAPLPGSRAAGPTDASAELDALEEKKRAEEAALRKNSDQLSAQRRNEEELRSTVDGVDPAEAERRARHLREQRDLLLAKKKAEREAKVAAEERKRRGEHDSERDSKAAAPARGFMTALDSKGDDKREEKGAPSQEELAEMRRATMRMALARRMKMDLIESEEAKLQAMQETQFDEYDQKLRQVEQMREDNRKREYLLCKQLAMQQEQIAKNMKLSAMQLRDDL